MVPYLCADGWQVNSPSYVKGHSSHHTPRLRIEAKLSSRIHCIGIIPSLPPPSTHSHSRKYTSILIPAQQRVLPVLRLRLLNIRPSPQEVLMRHDARELACYRAVDLLHHREVGGEEDVEIALVDLGGC